MGCKMGGAKMGAPNPRGPGEGLLAMGFREAGGVLRSPAKSLQIRDPIFGPPFLVPILTPHSAPPRGALWVNSGPHFLSFSGPLRNPQK